MQALRSLWDTAMTLGHADLTAFERERLRSHWQTQVSKVMRGKELLQPHRRKIPDVKEFKITQLSPNHPVFERAGLLKRKHAPMMESIRNSNRPMNRYIEHQMLRLNKARSNPALF